MCSRSVDGIIISVSSETIDNPLIKQYNEKGLPVVCFDRVLDALLTHKIVLANYKAGYDATFHLIKNGFKKIAFLGGAFHNSNTKERLAGYKAALEKYHFTVEESAIEFCDHGGHDFNEVQDSMFRLLKKKNKPDAIFVSSDKLTTNCLRYCNKHKISIPKELGVIGFSNLDLTELLFTPLTIIKQPAFEMGRLCAEHLIKTIESKRPLNSFEQIVLPAEIVVRESTRM
jgi:DNA-binding LacI/PurR family transcriptional regulator